MRLDEQCNEKTYKVGVMYCRAGQQTEEEMYNNEEGGPAFNEFLDLIGQRVRLKGFNKYKAGLCNKSKLLVHFHPPKCLVGQANIFAIGIWDLKINCNINHNCQTDKISVHSLPFSSLS